MYNSNRIIKNSNPSNISKDVSTTPSTVTPLMGPSKEQAYLRSTFVSNDYTNPNHNPHDAYPDLNRLSGHL